MNLLNVQFASRTVAGSAFAAMVACTGVQADDTLTDLMRACSTASVDYDQRIELARNDHGFHEATVNQVALRMAYVEQDRILLMATADKNNDQELREFLMANYADKMAAAVSDAPRNFGSENTFMTDADGLVLHIFHNSDINSTGCRFYSFDPNGPLPTPSDLMAFNVLESSVGVIQNLTGPAANSGTRTVSFVPNGSEFAKFYPDRAPLVSAAQYSSRLVSN